MNKFDWISVEDKLTETKKMKLINIIMFLAGLGLTFYGTATLVPVFNLKDFFALLAIIFGTVWMQPIIKFL